MKAISFIALLPNKQVSGIKFDIVKFFILLELFKLNTGWRPAQNERKITPQAQMSTDEVYVWKLKRASGGIYPFVPVLFLILSYF